MTPELSDLVLSLFLIFCRIGSCLMLLPGFSSTNVPVRIRLFIAFAISLALSPALLPAIQPLVSQADDATRFGLMFSEILTGLFIGLLGRIFMIALQFAGSVVANAIGMGQAFGVPMEEGAAVPTLTSLITLTATVLIFVLNLHAEIARALVASYTAMPATAGFSMRGALISLTDNLDEAFLLCLRVASPFVLYAVLVNFAIGLANKLTPTIPVYFISLPFVLAGGLVLLGYSIGDFLVVFLSEFEYWVLNG